ncbi:phage tail assembly chaperone [Agrobacterium tumefaciens]|uniref:phage tail assembly chaperone n=1 Tax=Agrobacterium tumefaciens TaxID=358 RepID=UPI0015730E69|nr:hypothetical protein [Agrobacterium tumefaciens]NSX90365.1 hypothetical protein [Agrobacterium tumefaciens]
MNLEKLLCAELKRQLDAKGVSPKLGIPAGGELLWRWFVDLNRARSYHMAGPNPISFAEIESYSRLMRWPIEPRHIAVLKAMDFTWLQYANKRSVEPPAGVRASHTISSTRLTAGMFDAIFG